MLNKLYTKSPELKNIPLKPYLINFSLDRLTFGVDNIHIDVHISPQLYDILSKTVFLMMVKHSHSELFFKNYDRKYYKIGKDTLKSMCIDVLQDGINKAKAEDEVQIDYLAQAALAKIFLAEVKYQYRNLVANFDPLIRTYQLSRRSNEPELNIIKEKLAIVKSEKNFLTRSVGEELFQILTEVNTRNLRNMRKTNFREEQILPDIFFNNPIIHADNPSDDFFLIEEYVHMGQRNKDSDNYDNVKAITYNLLDKTNLRQSIQKLFDENKSKGIKYQPSISLGENDLDLWIMEPENIDQLFNYFNLKKLYKKDKKGKKPKATLKELKQQIKIQKKMLNLFYSKFKKSGSLKQIVASFEMKSVYGIYCPPIAPPKIKEFLTDFWPRLFISYQLKNRKSVQGNAFQIAPLRQTLKLIKRLSDSEKKMHLLNFLRQFSRYHRDLYNSRILKQAMETISFVTKEKTILLSRGNRSLHEFLLPSEQVKKEKPVKNHVIIKADIRGSVKINNIMRNKGLNPASHFSLNFFDPISEILLDYNASKVFIEGDAIILSIFENEDSAESWYGVARACGMAIKILQIVYRYNIKNRENNLPLLEFGIGISYSDSPPAYLFDGDSRIMISPAINLADRLSGCSKRLRTLLSNHNSLFNIFVFKNVFSDDGEGGEEDDMDDTFIRYNVNGIEIDRSAFVKLSKEIKLKTITYSSDKNKKTTLYAGKVPTVSGNFQPIVIREDTIPKVNPENLDILGNTFKKYYEVCTHQKIYEFIADKID